MRKIKVTNFRKVKESCELELGPITFFTGTNNSGKSTILKALMVLSDYGSSNNHLELNFRGDNKWSHKIDCFHNAANWSNIKKGVHNIEFGFTNKEFEIIIVFKPLIQLFTKPDKIQNGVLESITIKKIINNSSFKMHHLENDKYQLSIQQEFIESRKSDPSNEIGILERNKNKIESRIEIIEAELKSNKELRTEIRLKEGLDKEKQTVKQINSKIKTILGEKKESMNSSVFNPVFEIQDLQDGLPMLDRILHVSLWKYFKENEMKTGYSDHRNISFSLMRTLDNITSAINFSVEHLSPHRNSQTRLYINDEHTNDIYNLISKHSKYPIKKKSKAGSFLKDWMKKFDIGENYDIQPIEGIASIVEIIEDGNRINLVDKGFGAGQIFSILLCIALKIDERENRHRNLNRRRFESRGESIIMIEEPEANLHPALQSKLTELFYDAYKKFGIRFIVETHSEYILRKSQLLVKQINSEKKEDTEQPFKVYYFDKDKGPYEMKYREDGVFEDSFGVGFFDVASQQALQLIKKSK